MNKRKNRITTFIVLASMLLGMSSSVWAADTASDNAGIPGTVSENNGQGPGLDRTESVLTELVQAGTITQDEMDKITQYLDAKRAEMKPGDQPTGAAISGPPSGSAISADQQANHPDQGNRTEMWAELVTAGIITQAQADAITAKMGGNAGGNNSGVGVKIDDKVLNLNPSPRIDNGRTLAPLRGIFEALGLSVSWDATTQTIVGSKDGTEITLKINSNTATVNGTSVSLDVPAQIVNGSTFVPVRFIADSLGVSVNWNSEDSVVEITTN
jgi:Copper amine oxidase N-terminal domain.